MWRKITVLSLWLVCWLLAGAGRLYAQGGGTLTFDGVERGYYLYVPSSYEPAQAMPLLVALHPAGSSGRAMAALTGLDAAAEREGSRAEGDGDPRLPGDRQGRLHVRGPDR